MEPEARQHTAGGRSPGFPEHTFSGFHGCHQAPSGFHVVTKVTTSIGCEKFDLQTLDARLGEIEDA
jgi:hypothetical protein